MIKTRLVRLLSDAKKYIIYQVIWQWLGLLCQVLIIFGITSLIGFGIAGLLNQTVFLEYLVMIAAGIALRFFCDRRAARASFQASVDVKRILRGKIYDKLLRLGTSYREQIATSEVVQMSAEGVEQLETYFGRYLPQFFYAMIAPMTLFVILSFQNVRASLILLICVPLIPVTIMMVQKIAKRLLSKYWGAYTELGDSFLENLQGLTTLKIYQADEKTAEKMDAESEHFRKITMKVLTMQLNSTSVMDIIALGGAAIGIIVTIRQLYMGNLTLPGALMIILLAAEFFIPMRVLGSYFHIAMNGMAASDKIFALLDLSEPEQGTETLDSLNPVQEAKDAAAADSAGSTENGGEMASGLIRADNLTFSYSEDREILHGIDLIFPAGSLTSLVGTSGCGKSTIAGILTGRNKSYGGSIKIADKELSAIKEESLMRYVTLVAHDSYLFKGTVRENLMMAMPEAEDTSLEQALEAVNLMGFLRQQDGLDTEILEQGSNLSGGQRQRLALARALLHDSPVYIFDEATSNIDSESEEMIMSVIRRLAETKTVILISHRLANVVTSDCIYMMEAGRIVQAGTHEELMAAGGAYSRLYEEQKRLEEYARPDADGHATLITDNNTEMTFAMEGAAE